MNDTVASIASTGQLLASGTALHRVGRLAEADACYRKILVAEPAHEEALHLRGVIAHQAGSDDVAIGLMNRAIRQNDNKAEFFSNLGNALRARGKAPEATAAYRRAIRLDPAYAEAYCNLAATLHDQGRFVESAADCRRAIGFKPDYARANFNLGNALRDQGQLAGALVVYRHAVWIAPDYVEAYVNAGNVLRELGEHGEAAAVCRQAIVLKPEFAEAYSNLGVALGDGAEFEVAAEACWRAARLKPEFAEACCNLGVALDGQGRLAEAVGAYRRSIAIKPGYGDGYCNLGNVLKDRGLIDEAIACYRRALELEPGHAVAHSNLLLAMNYPSGLAAEAVMAEHLGWDEQHGQVRSAPTVDEHDRDARRRLRIAYVSPDFREHSVAYFLEPLLRAHDRREVEVFCYAEVLRPDAVTERLSGLADQWLTTVGMTDEALAERIGDDRIDILVDVAGHTRGNRLLAFARKPAPVQISWLGYPNTTGMASIDYRLVDAITDPEGEADAWASERLVRLAGGFLCYAGPAAAEPAAPPCLSGEVVTFGSFNNPAKLSSLTLETWAALLCRLPNARLVLKGKPFLDAETREIYLARFRERGVSAEQVTLLGYVAGAAHHLALYERIDIALDPFPYNGTTTTCEAMWMGVPVVCLAGGSHAGRVGASLLNRVGLTEFLAGSTQDYVEIAVALAGNRQRLQDLRRSLRARMAASVLCDTLGFARRLEATYRTLWQHWCEMP